MKYLVLSTFEIDGHSSATSCICTSSTQLKQYLTSLLWDEDKKAPYPIDYQRKNEEDDSKEMWGHWDCGQWCVKTIPFKTYKEITAKEYYCQTG